MTLDYSIANCRDWEELNSDEEWNVTQGIIFSTMWVGMGSITEKNWKQFYERLTIQSMLVGGSGLNAKNENGEWVPYRYTPEDVYRRIGLTTNVSPKTDAVFRKDALDNVKYDINRDIEKFLSEKEDA
jgi:hypothetical protein